MAKRKSEKTKSGITEQKILLVVVIGLCLLLGVSPRADRVTWFMENAPIFIVIPMLFYLQPRVHLTNMVLRLLALHALVLMIGGHYTYAEVPFGYWMKDLFGFARNHYDRIGHFMQGFVPAFVFRELLIKKSPLKKGLLLNTLVITSCMAVSAFYEFIEWWAALILGQGADAFLGSQGDQWDTQWDMFLATVGASVAVFLLGGLQDRAISRQKSPRQ